MSHRKSLNKRWNKGENRKTRNQRLVLKDFLWVVYDFFFTFLLDPRPLIAFKGRPKERKET